MSDLSRELRTHCKPVVSPQEWIRDTSALMSELADGAFLMHGSAPYLRMAEQDQQMYRDWMNGIPFRGAVTQAEVNKAMKLA